MYYLLPAITGLILAVYPVSAAQTPATPNFIEKDAKTVTVWVTAYSSAQDETDNTPFITAHNTHVRDGIVASNMFPFGTLVKIPEYFGDKVFVVDDRMHRRKANFVDVWMPTKEDAKKFGIVHTNVLVLEPTVPPTLAMNEKSQPTE